MSAEDEQIFQSSNKSWICDKIFDVGDNKIRDYCHVIGKYKGSAHWSCNINLGLSKKVTLIFQNLRGCDSNLIIMERGKFYVKVSAIPNGLETCMAFIINNNFFSIDSMQFLNSSLVALVTHLSETDFKFLSQEFSGALLELVKQKVVHPNEYMDRFK